MQYRYVNFICSENPDAVKVAEDLILFRSSKSKTTIYGRVLILKGFYKPKNVLSSLIA